MRTQRVARWLRLAGIFLGLAVLPTARAQAQDLGRLRAVSDGDGRIHGGPTMPVSEADLQPGQVQTLNLHPRYHAVLEFPYPIARIDAGDPEVFSATIVGNKVTIKATKVSRAETSMSIMLGDAQLTVVPFLVRADSTEPFAYVIRYTDPVAKHLNQAEAQIAAALQRDVDLRVAQLSEVRMQQRLLTAGDVVRIAQTGEAGRPGERLLVTIESAQQLPGDDGRPRLYVRYRARNETVAPLTDLVFSAHVERSARRGLVFTTTTSKDLYDVTDVRSVTTIPPGAAATGLLIFDDFALASDEESLTLDIQAFNGQRRLTLHRVLVGPGPR